ncbi:MAG: hypothetical protein ABI039_11840 [Vicinamibacterales bacterium]
MRYRSGLASAVLVAALGVTPSATAEIPAYMKSMVGTTPPTAAALATSNVLHLNVSMFELYEQAAQVFRKNILANHPVILALFSGGGGRMILYRPGQPPLDAPSVPVVYQVMKSLGHSTMAISEVVIPYIDQDNDKTWIAPMQGYLAEMKSARAGIDAVVMPEAWRPVSRSVLDNNIAYMEECLLRGVIRLDALQAYTKKQGPNLKSVVNWGASTQVKHWMSVMDDWAKMLGPDLAKAFGASNTIYVARQNNVLFSVLAQYFGPDAINDRLMLIETVDFQTTPENMLTSLTRIISDRAVGEVFFGSPRLMDYELMGGDARKTIISEMKARGKEPFLPPAVPFGSKQWPALISGGFGPASLDDLK